jgi:hypothetical protein
MKGARMSNKLLFVLFLLLLSTTLLFSQTTTAITPVYVNETMIEADTVGNPNYTGLYTRIYTGLLNVGVETQMVLKGSSHGVEGDTVLVSPTWDVLSAPTNSTAAVMSPTALDFASELVLFTPDSVGTYVVQFTSDGVTSTVTINAGTFLGVEGGATSCMSCHNDTYTKWAATGHGTIFNSGLNGTLSDHWGESCINCHTTGYDTLAVNDGFDDFTFVFPDSFGPGMLDSMTTTYPSAMMRANIQCEACHGPGSAHMGDKSDSKIVAGLEVNVCASCHQAGTHHIFPSQYAYSVHSNPEALSDHVASTSCGPCHTGSGFVAWIKSGKTGLTEDPAVDKITCAVCHDPHDASIENQLRTVDVTLETGEVITEGGKGKLCMNCHRSRRVADEYTGPDFGYSSHFGAHHGPQAEIVLGKNMPTFGKTLPSSPHFVGDACVNCHMAESTSPGAGGHTFSMVDTSGMDNVAACEPCHGDVGESFSEKKYYMNGVADHDGDGVDEGLQEEVEGMMEELAMMLPPIDSNAVDIGGDYVYTQTEAKAAYNYITVEEDRSMGVHNPAFVVSLLKISMQAVENLSALGTTIAVDDVPNDQGKQVRVIWNKSVDDGVAIDPIATYVVKRDDGDETMTTVGELTADGSERYALVVPTLYDSTVAGDALTSFVVVAVSEGGATHEYAPLAGHSIDNLVPMAPQGVAGMVASGDVTLNWDEAVDPDVKYYRVFRSTESGFTADEASEIGTTASLEYVDADAAGTVYYKVKAVDFSGNNSDASDEIEVIATAMGELELPLEFALSQNYPNPFNPSTHIQVSLRDAGRVTLEVYNALGQKITTLVNRDMVAGVHTVNFDGTGLSSGIYFYKVVIKTGNSVAFQDLHKMILMK